jgi:hypothetical protein
VLETINTPKEFDESLTDFIKFEEDNIRSSKRRKRKK